MLYRLTLSISLLGVALLSMLACSETQSPDQSNPNFPQLREGDTEHLDAMVVGELVSENGCLRVRNSERGIDHLLIWPHGYEMAADGQRVRTSDGSEFTLSVGQEIRIGGGQVPLHHIQTSIIHPIPSNCLGDSYWVVGEIPASSQ